MTTYYSYPAVFREDIEGNSEILTITFPDIPGCISCGDGLEEAYLLAADALWMSLDWFREAGESFPLASLAKNIPTKKYESVHIIKVNLDDDADLVSEGSGAVLMERDGQIITVPTFGGRDLPQGIVDTIRRLTGVSLFDENSDENS